MIRSLACLAGLALTSCSLLFAQTPTVIDGTFDPGAGASGDIFAVALQPDGKIIAGGQFAQFNGISRSRIVRLNTNGTVDAAFAPGAGVNGDVYAVAVQPDGKILIGGAFTAVDGVNHTNLARLLTNGLPDPDFLAPVINNELRVIIVQSDERILIAGRFTTVG